MDENKTMCKRINLDMEEDGIEKDDIPQMTQRKRIKLELINEHQGENIIKDNHLLDDVLGKEALKNNDLSKNYLISKKKDFSTNFQDKSEILDGDFSKEPQIQKVKSMDSTSMQSKPQKTAVCPLSSSPADGSQDSEMNELENSEIDQLREFQVLDEIANDENKESDENGSDWESEQESAVDGEEEILDIADDEIEQMLEENLPEDFKGQPRQKPRPYGQRKKLVLEEKGINHFEVLPLDWIVVRHMSGMPIYLHRPTRVCTLAKPYFLGKASARKHEIPMSAIPCLYYRRALEEEKKQKDVDPTKTVELPNGTDILKSDTPAVNGENVNSKKSSLSQCPFAKEQTKSNSQDNSIISIDPNFENSSEENSHHNIDENSALSTIEDVVDNIASLSNKPDNVITNDGNRSTNVTLSSVTNSADREMTDDNVASTENKKIENMCKVEEIINGKTELNENNIVSIDNETFTTTSNEYNTDSNNANTTKPVGIASNITVFDNKRVLPGGIVLPNVKIETASSENWKNQHLAHEQVTEYCKNLFHFRTINIMRFVQWSDRRKYSMAKKTIQRPTLPEGTKLITIPAQPAGTGSTGLGGRPGQKEWAMNPNGRSYVCIFHEYLQRALQKKPTYEFVQLENAATPYKVTVYLNGMQYGVGYGTSKRQAKSMAAKASIEVLIPEMRDKVTEDSKIYGVACRSDNPDFAFFDFLTIDDPRIAEFCAKTMEPSPHAILHTCLLRNFGVGSQEIKYETKPLKRQRIEFTMTVGKHTATVVCKKKKDGKQRAAQAILQALHPHITSWGSLLRLYGSRSLKSFKEKKIEEQEITLLQGKAKVNTPNYAILNKLKAEMERLRQRDTAVVPIGTLVVTDGLPTHSGSNLDNVEI